jgi:ATP-dependent exoDNAse (exonuclease V) beta subunit
MPKNPQSWQSLAFKNRHPRDLQIEFDEPTHRYTVNGSSDGWTSCTGFLHSFFPHFDPDTTIKKMMKSPKWPQSKYYGMTASEIKNQWNSSGKEASEAGTAMHLGIEMFHNDAEVDDSIKDSVEWKYFQNYWKECGEDLEPYRTEWEVWSEEHKLAGSIDMIYRRKSDGKFIIYDWKRSKEIKTTNTFENGYAPLGHLPNCNYWHYTLQLNVYKWFLETFYGLEVAELYLIILHPDNTNYRRLRLNILPDEVQEMLNCRKRAVEAGSKSLVLLPIGSEEDV